MGVFRGRGATIDRARQAAAMRPALYAWFNAQIQIFDPNLRDAPAYAPLGDTGGVATPSAPLYDSGVNGALIQPIRSPVMVQQGDQTIGLLGIRMQVKMPATPPVLRAGLRVRVVNGGNVPEITFYRYVLNEALDTSAAWGKIIEATVDTSRTG